MRRFMGLSVAVPAMVLVLGLAACSSGPSTSEAKAAVMGLIGGPCNRLSISDFEKVNGLAQPDGGYQVSVKYLLVVAPPQEHGGETQAGYDATLADIHQRHQQLQSKIDAQDKVVQDLQVQVLSLGHLGLQDSFTQQSQQLDGLIAQRKAIETEEQQATGEPLAQFQAACPTVSADVQQALASGAQDFENAHPGLSAYLNGFSVGLSGTINLVKTDKGWQAGL